MTVETKGPDWERIEQHYRAGLLSLREIALACPGANHVAIARRAKKYGWVQDLSAKIKARAEDIVTRQVVTPDVTEKRAVTDRAVIEANAQSIAEVRLSHRKDIARGRNLTNKLLDELEGMTDNRDLFAELGELLRSEDDKGQDRRNDLYQKVIDLPARTKTMKELAETMKTLITLERDALGITSDMKVDHTNSDGSLSSGPTRIEIVAPSMFKREETED